MLAERPKRINELIQIREVNSEGIYMLNFFVNGQIESVVIDDYLPVFKGTNELAFAHSKPGELWVSLLEKGWAKLHGCYEAMSVGYPSFAVSHLLGVHAHTLHHAEKDLDKLWLIFRKAEQRKYKMIA